MQKCIKMPNNQIEWVTNQQEQSSRKTKEEDQAI